MNKKYTSRFVKKLPGRHEGLYYDALYGYIPTSGVIRKLINLEIFQRLRGIKQLSTLYLGFPGATHTRFEHSVGVCYLAQLVHERLREYLEQPMDADLKKITLNEITCRAMEISALLHDVGHGPFCHVFEMFCKRESKYRDWTHEKWGRKLITGKDESGNKINQKIFQQIPSYLEGLRETLGRKYPGSETLPLLEPANIAALCFDAPIDLGSAELSARYSFLRDVIPSPFGTDRLDYLRRDALYTGVKTGDIDIWEIIGNMRILMHDGRSGLFLMPSAAIAVELLLKAREAVWRRLYYNPTHRTAQEMLIRALLELDPAPAIEDLGLFTDADLLQCLDESNVDFVQEVAERIRFRILYESFQIANHEVIHLFEDKLEKFWKTPNGWKEFIKIERRLGEQVGIPEGTRALFDVIKVPAIKEEDFTKKIFYDPVKKILQNLCGVHPHIAQLYKGNLPFLGRKITKIHAYNDSVSPFTLCIPFDHIYQGIKEEIATAQATSPYKKEKRIEAIFTDKFEPLIQGFFTEILEEDVENFAKELSSCRQRIIYYLTEVIDVYRNEVEATSKTTLSDS